MKKYFLFLLLPGLAIFQFCSSAKKTRVSEMPAPAIAKVNFDGHVKPLIISQCAPCHTTGNKVHLVNYNEAVGNADDMIRRVNLSPGEKGFMPFKHDKLPDSAIAVFVKWKADGLIEKAAP